MITLDYKDLIYTEPVCVIDTNSAIPLYTEIGSTNIIKPGTGEITNDVFDKHVGSRFLYIQFATEVPSHVNNDIRSMLSDSPPDPVLLMKYTVKEAQVWNYRRRKYVNSKVLYFPNIMISKIMKPSAILNLVSTIVGIYVTNDVKCYLTTHYDSTYNFSTSPTKLTAAELLHYESSYMSDIYEAPSHEIEYSIGNCSMLTALSGSYNDFNIFDRNVYFICNNLMRDIKTIKEGLSASNNNKIRPPEKITPFITQFEILMTYMVPIPVTDRININTLFTSFNVKPDGIIQKTSICRNSMKTINDNTKLQYYKICKGGQDSFKSLPYIFNMILFMIGDAVGKGLTVSSIAIDPCGNILITVTNNNIKLTAKDIPKIMKPWCCSRVFDILDESHYKTHCYANIEREKYVVSIQNISTTFSVTNIPHNIINASSYLFRNNAFISQFASRSSLQFSAPSYCDNGLIYTMYCLAEANYTIPMNITKLTQSSTHIMFDGMRGEPGSLRFTMTKVHSFHEMSMLTMAILGLCPHYSVDTDSNIVLHEGMSLENIITASQSHDSKRSAKALLKQLIMIDPILFGNRDVVGGISRPYSSLCQKHKQRPVPITEEEYDFIRNEGSMETSIANLKNQTYPTQRIYLLCPYKMYPFMNFHVLRNNQPCIVRCTTKNTNKSQYDFCTTQLGTIGARTIVNRYENQSITKFNPLINPGRLCKLPDELLPLFTNVVLKKIPIVNTIECRKWCIQTYDREPYIIERNLRNMEYFIVGDNIPHADNILCICVPKYEYDEQIRQTLMEYNMFIIFDNIIDVPMTIDKCKGIEKVFNVGARKTNCQFKFFNYLKRLTRDKHLSVVKDFAHTLMSEFARLHNLRYVLFGDTIHFVIINKVIYSTPKMRIYGNITVGATYITHEMMFSLLDTKVLTWPTLTNISPAQISTLYVDYVDNKCKGIIIDGLILPVVPMNVPMEYIDIKAFRVDMSAFMNTFRYMGTGYTPIYEDELCDKNKMNVRPIIDVFVAMCVKRNTPITEDQILKYLKEFKILQNGPTKYEFEDEDHIRIDWRNAQTNITDVKKYIESHPLISSYMNKLTVHRPQALSVATLDCTNNPYVNSRRIIL